MTATISTSQSIVPGGSVMVLYGPGQRGNELGEYGQILGDGEACFGGMIGVVEAYRKDLARLWYRIAELTRWHLC